MWSIFSGEWNVSCGIFLAYYSTYLWSIDAKKKLQVRIIFIFINNSLWGLPFESFEQFKIYFWHGGQSLSGFLVRFLGQRSRSNAENHVRTKPFWGQFQYQGQRSRRRSKIQVKCLVWWSQFTWDSKRQVWNKWWSLPLPGICLPKVIRLYYERDLSP